MVRPGPHFHPPNRLRLRRYQASSGSLSKSMTLTIAAQVDFPDANPTIATKPFHPVRVVIRRGALHARQRRADELLESTPPLTKSRQWQQPNLESQVPAHETTNRPGLEHTRLTMPKTAERADQSSSPQDIRLANSPPAAPFRRECAPRHSSTKGRPP